MLFSCDINGDYSVCLTINDTKYEYMCRNFNACGIRSPLLFKGPVYKGSPAMGALMGHMNVIEYAKLKKWPYVFVFEDDAYPRLDVSSLWKSIQNDIPDDCGIFCLGYSGWKLKSTNINSKIVQCDEKPFGAHAYVIRQESYDDYLKSVRLIKCPDKAFMADNYKTCKYKPYWPTPDNVLFIQKNISGMSNISSVIGAERYWWPNHDGFPLTKAYPHDKFTTKILDACDEDKFVVPIHKTLCPRWKFKSLTFEFKDDTIKLVNGEIGKLSRVNPHQWLVIWENGTKETLTRVNVIGDVYYYSLTE